MAIDSTVPVRKAILSYLKNTRGVTNIIPEANIFTSRVPLNPPWPFLRYEQSGASSPIKATCLDGQQMDIRLHVFAKPKVEGGLVVQTAEDHVCFINQIMLEALDNRRFDIDRGHMHVKWAGAYCRVDRDEADAYHGMVDFRIRTMTR